MEHGANLDELLIAYLLNESDARQDALVRAWIEADKGNQRYFEELRKITRLVELKQNRDIVNIDKEWNHFNQLKGNKEKVFDFEYKNERLTNNSVASRYPIKKWATYKVLTISVAASILLVIAFGLKLTSYTPPSKTNVFVQAKHINKKLEPTLKQETNNSDKPKTFLLPDGTKVLLEKNSEIGFTNPFFGNKRDIYIKGKARFEVAKDKSKPFTVFSGDLATTALGTAFTVNAYQHADKIVVRLYEGKVLIRSADDIKRKLKNVYYLKAGQELIYDNLKSVAKVRSFKVAGGLKAVLEDCFSQKTFHDSPSIPLHNKGSWYMFNNQPLTQVFEQLKSIYDVDIIYDRKDIQKMYFIGRFSKSDSLEVILTQITSLNSLALVKKRNRYVINKKLEK